MSALYASRRPGRQLSNTVRGAFARLGRDERRRAQRRTQWKGCQPLYRRAVRRQERR